MPYMAPKVIIDPTTTTPTMAAPMETLRAVLLERVSSLKPGTVGAWVGATVGNVDGFPVGASVGNEVEGLWLGYLEGATVGWKEGWLVGYEVTGFPEGVMEG